ncbi:hypothetical protein CEXT_619051 [Caerostris extrusa]|uniref:Uncharacterized protein n=1 Tax=Caerostris extrusa TaxID=172846 RepID=A0AAV4T520_CAEEX|nr:hypothetical protein CEXT_619051 [Caerostris extrusa]
MAVMAHLSSAITPRIVRQINSHNKVGYVLLATLFDHVFYCVPQWKKKQHSWTVAPTNGHKPLQASRRYDNQILIPQDDEPEKQFPVVGSPLIIINKVARIPGSLLNYTPLL